MKPIQTVYKGYRFRSRLEARWAVFFDALGYSWEYEPEGFDLGFGVRYLPDFRIWGTDTNPDPFVFWIEIKPEGWTPTPDEQRKHLRFAQGVAGTAYHVSHIVCAGLPSAGAYKETDEPEYWYMLWSYRKRPWFIDGNYPEELASWRHTFDRYHRNEPPGASPMDDLDRAVDAARAARFEFGEVGA